jgi:hypothetical protein
MKPIFFIEKKEKEFIELTSNYWEEILKIRYSISLSKKVNVILNELLNNAIKYTDNKENDIEIYLDADEQKVEISVANSAELEKIKKFKELVSKLKNKEELKFLLKEKTENKDIDGFGLIKLIMQNFCNLDLEINENYVVVKATINI